MNFWIKVLLEVMYLLLVEYYRVKKANILKDIFTIEVRNFNSLYWAAVNESCLDE